MRHTIKIDIYYTTINLRVVANVKKCVKSIYKKNGYEIVEEEKYIEDDRGCAFNFTADQQYMVLSSKTITHGLIAHELWHIVEQIRKDKGSTEVDASYLVETVTDKIYAFLKAKNVVIG